MTNFSRVFLCAALFIAGSAFAASPECQTVTPLTSLSGILYKPENIHGGRGPTFLVQSPKERTSKRSIEIRDVNCKKIGSFGLWATDWPYGARYYQAVKGGSSLSAKQLYSKARKAGSSSILVQGVNKWIRVTNPLKREGKVYSP